MIIVQLFILGLMAGCWGFLWNIFIEKKIPVKWSINIRKPLGECLICTAAWWVMLIFYPLFIWLNDISYWWYLMAPIVGGLSSATAVNLNYIARKTILDKEYYDAFKRDQLSKNFQSVKPSAHANS